MIAVLVAVTLLAAPPPVTFAFEAVSAKPGDRVVIHADGLRTTQPVRLYLVRSALRTTIRSARDPRLAYIATVRPRRGHAMTTFTVPALARGTYVPWCARCGTRMSGRLVVEP